ncbi:hypothetical protein CDD82_2677 [Ophiocordyceps australis]|uniref:DUF924-domain-containing protein n=1 Tax=Ophiocordyceps australis TaxID=1399860 RepID=A0A2C5ZQ90_9HYPO|nr:hypothetical protein CDD82_2677 [Ophiocordyceps australis]
MNPARLCRLASFRYFNGAVLATFPTSSLSLSSRPRLLLAKHPSPFSSLNRHLAHSSSRAANMTQNLESQLTPTLLSKLHEFWFQHLDGPDALVVPSSNDNMRWFAGGAELDGECVNKFGAVLEAIRQGGFTSGADLIAIVKPENPLDWLSLVILLDQIPRNCYRGDAAAQVFTVFDPLALHVALEAIKLHIPDSAPEIRWRLAYRHWFYLPLMHSEDASVHEMALREYEKLRQDVQTLISQGKDKTSGEDKYHAEAAKVAQGSKDEALQAANGYLSFEKKHADIIKEFGRYPHRNKALGRKPTPQETAYLEAGGETFGQKSKA